jgi:hypothetical protein
MVPKIKARDWEGQREFDLQAKSWTVMDRGRWCRAEFNVARKCGLPTDGMMRTHDGS